MILQRLIILNYQSCRKVLLDFESDTPTILIGINDSGKSVILKAIGLLLELPAPYAFQRDVTAKRDLSNTVLEREDFETAFKDDSLPLIPYSAQETCIVGKFFVEEGDFDKALTDGLSNHLLWTLETAEDSSIWMARVFNSVGSQDQYLLTPDVDSQHPDLQELWAKKSNELKSLRTTLGVTDEEIENVNKVGRFTNLEQIRPLYARTTLQNQWRKYPDYKKEKDYFPQYRYLNWDFSLDDLKKVANDAMKSIIDQHTNSLKTQASSEALLAEKTINETLAGYVPLLQEDAPTVSGLKTRLIYEVKPSISDILLNKINADSDIHLDSQGEGVKRQIWFGLIRIAAKQAARDKSGRRRRFIWCFDEPETHLYPAAQRKFFDALKSLSSSEIEIIVSTHSTVFVDRTKLDSIRNTVLENGYTTVGTCSDIDAVFRTLQLKNSDFLFYDKFLIVEGETEIEILPHFYQTLNNRTLVQDGIQLIMLGGKEKRAENIRALRSILKGFRKPENCVRLLLDGDPRYETLPTDSLRVNYVGKQDLEDAFEPDVWLRALSLAGLDGLITKERIDQIREEIPESKTQNNRKFLEKLKTVLLSNKEGEDRQRIIANFPRKGTTLGRLLKEATRVREEIPKELRQALQDV